MSFWLWRLLLFVLVTAGSLAIRRAARRARARRPAPEDLARAREQVRGRARPTLRLVPARTPGGSRLGGLPDLPEDLAWPTTSSGPLAFVAQIDLAEARAADGPDWLPGEGMLFVFNDEERYGFPDHMRALLSARRGEAPREPPAPLPPQYDFPPHPVGFLRAPSAPSLDWLNLDPRLADAVQDLYETYEPDHRLGGYPDEIQPGSMPLECETLARRYYPQGRSAWSSTTNPVDSDWRLLLQIDSDDAPAFLWHDTGRLFLFVRESDARAGDFTQTVALMQSC